MAHTNRLISETSPYLLQHAHNPVDWFPWGPEALKKAKTEDKPILVSIGYSSCHWCHVMERESFEDEEVASFMNSHFVCIKIDREERPDLDHFFMDALQAISGSGGWPLNMFLTANGHPFYGGTYYPPRRYANRISWIELLQQINEAYKGKKSEIDEQAANLLDYLRNSGQPSNWKSVQLDVGKESTLDADAINQIAQNLLQSADREYGGFGSAPKFPQTFSLQFLLHFGYFTETNAALKHVEKSLFSMMRGGIYDQIGGGFCRYATDNRWLVPHFEKMTYDNALLLNLMTEAYQLTSHPDYQRTVEQTVAFMLREMRSPEGGYYAALDADSDGIEGKFYTWTLKEWREVVDDEAEGLTDLFGITEEGNWEDVNIPHLSMSIEEWAEKKGKATAAIMETVGLACKKLLGHRSTRVRPQTDNKIILAWNALYNKALSKAAIAFDRSDWRAEAIQHMEFLLHVFYDSTSEQWSHTYSSGVSRELAMLDDLSLLVDALYHLHVLSGNTDYLKRAIEVLEYTDRYHGEKEGIYYWYSSSLQGDVLVRKKDVYDGAMPSGNATMAWNLYRLGIISGRKVWKERAEQMAMGMLAVCQRYPTSFGLWASLLLEIQQETYEIVILGDNASEKARTLLRTFAPNKVLLVSKNVLEEFPLLEGKSPTHDSTIFICKNQFCLEPVQSTDSAVKMLLTKS